MKYIIILLAIMTILSQFSCESAVNKKEAEYQCNNKDSILLLSYKYKEKGKKKSANGDNAGAIQYYSKAIELRKDYDTAYYNRAIIKERIGDKKGALKDYNKAIEISPAFIEPYINQGVLKHELKDHEGELSNYRIAIKHCKPNANLYNNLGRALYDLERFKESADAYGDGIKYFPEDYRLYYGRGMARKRIGDKNGACEDWIKSSELGCIQANMLLPLCEEYIQEKNDSLKRQKEAENEVE